MITPKPVRYNPDKTHFEQQLEFIEYLSNPDINFTEYKIALSSFLDNFIKKNKMNPEDAAAVRRITSDDFQQDTYTYERFIRDGKKTYIIAKDFSEALAEASLDISCRYIPTDAISYNIQFHKDYVLSSLFDSENVFYRNCYVSIEACDTEYDKKKGYLKRIRLVFPIYQEGNLYNSTYDYINLVFREDKQKVRDAILESSKKAKDYKMSEKGIRVIQYIVNVILYINSGDPDLRYLNKPKIPKITKNVHKFHKKNKHKPLLDIIKVGFNYLKGIKYNVSSTVVRGHFRWQPHGEGRGLIKLIWIGEHERHFNNKT